MEKCKVRTTIEPGKVIEVSEQEFTDLLRQGLIAPDRAPKNAKESKP